MTGTSITRTELHKKPNKVDALRKIINCLPVIFLLFNYSSHAENANENFAVFAPFTLPLEVKQSPVSQVHRDKAGRLWLGTQNGLYKYDGNSSQKYGPSESDPLYLSDAHIRSITEDKNGSIYAAPFAGGLVRWNKISSKFERVDTSTEFEDLAVSALTITESGIVWMLSKTKILTYDPSKPSETAWRAQEGISKLVGSPRNIIIAGDRAIVVAGDNGVFKSNRQHSEWSKIQIQGSSTEEISALTAAADNRYYIGYQTGLVQRFSENATLTTSIDFEIKLGNGRINDIQAMEGSVFFATDSGLIQTDLDLSAKQLIKVADGSAHFAVDDLFLDNDSIWAATIEGPYLLTFSDFKTEGSFHKSKSNIVFSFTYSESNKLWVGTYDALYSVNIDPDFKPGDDFPNPVLELDSGVSSLAQMGSSTIVGLFNGGARKLVHTEKGTEFRNIPGLSFQTVTSMDSNKIGKEAWIGTYKNGLYRVSENEIQSYFSNGRLPEPTVTLVHLTKYSGELYIISFNKIYQYSRSDENFELLNLDFGKNASDPIVYSMIEAPNGDLWIGTKSQGLFRLSTKSKGSVRKNLTQIDGVGDIHHTTVYSMSIDDNGDLWCATQSGIFRYDIKRSDVSWYTTADGLLWSDFSLGAAYKSSSGTMFFGGSSGLTYFDPDIIGDVKRPSRIVISSIELGDGTNELGSAVSYVSAVASYRDRHARFRFTSLDFTDPTKNQYRYKLENFDEDWVNSGSQNSATYTNLPSGNYRFVVQAANSSGIWNTEGASIDLVVLPPPWLTWWAYCLYIALAALMLWGLHRIYYSFAIARKANELAFEMHLAEERADDDMQEQIELQQDLVQSAYEHNKTTLALISDVLQQRSTTTSDTEASIRNTSYQSRMDTLSFLEECLYFQAGGSVVDLYKLTESIFEQMLPKATVDPGSLITINQVTKQLVPATIASPVALLICELVENAILHAFSNQSPANYVQVGFSRSALGDPEGDFWLLEVSDNGVGADLNQPLSGAAHSATIETAHDASSGFGLQIVHQLAEQLGASVRTKSAAGSFIAIQIPAS